MSFSMFCCDHNFNQNLAWLTFRNLDRMKTGNMGIQSRPVKETCLPNFYGVVCLFLFLQSLDNVWQYFRGTDFFPRNFFFFAECVMEVSVSDITSDAFVIPWDLHGFF